MNTHPSSTRWPRAVVTLLMAAALLPIARLAVADPLAPAAVARHLGYVPVSGEGAVYVIDTASQTLLKKISDVGSHPTVLRILSDRSKIYVDNFGPERGEISVIDTLTDTVLKKIPTHGLPFASIQLAPDGRFLYVPTSASLMQVIDTRSDQVVRSFALPGSPIAIEVSPDGRRLYVFFSDNTVAPFDAQTGDQLRPRLPVQGVGPDWGALSADGRKLYAMNELSDSISVIDTQAWAVVKNLPLPPGSAPVSGTLTPDGSQLYVCNIGTRDISILDTRTDTFVEVVPTTHAPVVVGFSADGRRAYLSDLGAASAAFSAPLGGTIGLAFFSFLPGLPGHVVTYDTRSHQPIGRPVVTGTGPIVGVYD